MFMLTLQPSILPIQIIRIGQLVILCLPGGTNLSPGLFFTVLCYCWNLYPSCSQLLFRL